MRIILDVASALQSDSRFRGIGRFGHGFVEGLLRSPEAKNHEIFMSLCANRDESIDEITRRYESLMPPERIVSYRLLDDIQIVDPSTRWRLKTSDLIRNFFHESMNPDAIVSINLFEGYLEDMSTSVIEGRPDIITAAVVHDLIPLLNLDTYLSDLDARAWYFDKVDVLAKTDLALTISKSAKQEVMAGLNRPEERIVNIMSAANNEFFRLEDDDNRIRKYKASLGITKPFFLHVGTYESRKNYERLIEAFAKLSEVYPGEYQLVLGTKPNPQQRIELEQKVRANGLDLGDVIVTDWMSDFELNALYATCYCFIYPSLHEGFGLPVLEAMMSGAAVIASNVTSIPEVVAYDEALFDPYSVQDMFAHMDRTIYDKEYYAQLLKLADERPAEFTWNKVADKFFAGLESEQSARGQMDRPKTGKSERYRDLIAKIKSNVLNGGPDELDRRNTANAISENLATLARIPPEKRTKRVKYDWHVEGPYSSSYSLAIVNRMTAMALHDQGEFVALRSTEGPGDIPVDEEFLKENSPEVLELPRLEQSLPARSHPVVTLRNLFPPRVSDAPGSMNILHPYAWEESLFPQEWVEAFNVHLDGICCTSNHVRRVLQDSGVAIPLAVTGNGIDNWDKLKRARKPRLPRKSFKFLHNSSCFPRKGADVLLDAYGKAFRKSDDVCLIIKTFENPHNDIASLLASKKEHDADFPTVKVIFGDLSEAELKALYESCDAMVLPSRAEGFGLPNAEAMLSDLAVIATNWSGHLDFCNEQTAWLVDFQFTLADTHFGQTGSVWAEPDTQDLANVMRAVYETPKEKRQKKIDKGKAKLRSQFRWADVTQRMMEAVHHWSTKPYPKLPKIGWASRWNTRCGIATYSEHFVSNMPQDVTIFAPSNDEKLAEDGPRVRRVWMNETRHASLDEFDRALDNEGIETLVIQWNYVFFDFEVFNVFLLRQRDKGRQVILFMHATSDPPHDPDRHVRLMKDGLNSCERVVVHSYRDLNVLKAIGVVDNTMVFPHGLKSGHANHFSPGNKPEFTLATYGFCLPHKGLLQLLDAFRALFAEDPSLRLHYVNAEHPAPVSIALLEELRAKISEYGLEDCVRITSAFLPDHESMQHLTEADLLVFPYEETGESASGAVRFGISSGRPVATTPLPIFDDVAPATFALDGTSTKDVEDGLRRLIKELRDEGSDIQKKQQEAQNWRDAHSYEALARRLVGMISAYSWDKPANHKSASNDEHSIEQQPNHGEIQARTPIGTMNV